MKGHLGIGAGNALLAESVGSARESQRSESFAYTVSEV